MTEQSIIILSQNIKKVENRNETVDCIDQQMISWVLDVGALPVTVPNSLGNNITPWILKIKPKGIILTGVWSRLIHHLV